MFEFIQDLFGKRQKSEEEMVLIRAVADDPANNAPRLAYASWLKEKHDPYGEFIEIDCEMSSLDETDARYVELDTRYGELMHKHGKKWVKPLKELELQPISYGVFAPSLWFERGFIEHVTIDKRGAIPGKAERLFELAPALRKLTIERCSPDFFGIAACPLMERIRSLDLSAELRMSDYDARALITSPHFEKLTELDVSGKDFGDAIVEALVSSQMSHLRELKLGHCQLSQPAARKLSQWPGLSTVRDLNLNGNQIDAEGASAILNSPHLANVESLDLGGNSFEASDALLLADANLANLQSLSLEASYLGPLGMKALLASSIFDGVTKLDLCHDSLGDDGICQFAESPQISKISKLRIGGNDLTATGVGALLSSPHLAELREFDIGFNHVGADGAQLLVESAKLANVRKLHVYGIECGEEWEKRLAEHFGEDVIES